MNDPVLGPGFGLEYELAALAALILLLLAGTADIWLDLIRTYRRNRRRARMWADILDGTRRDRGSRRRD